MYFVKFIFNKALIVFGHPVIDLEQRFFSYVLVGIVNDLLAHEKLCAAINVSESFAATINGKV